MWRIILFIGLSFFSVSSFAFGKLGHQLVCQIAFDHLSPATQQTITSMLANLPAQHKALINRYTYQSNEAEISFANACTWADAIKSDKAYDSMKPWHYINVARDETHIEKGRCKNDCITKGIAIHKKQLKSSTDAWQKVQALMFLGHWIGDIHQPLHVSFASDWGGNKIKVNSPDGKCTNLHWLWDECLITREKKDKQQWLNILSQRWQTSPVMQWQKSDQWQWANESLQLVRQPALGYCAISNGVCLMNNDASQLYNAQYQERFSAVVQERMLKAAIRLAQQLETSL